MACQEGEISLFLVRQKILIEPSKQHPLSPALQIYLVAALDASGVKVQKSDQTRD